MKAIDLNKVDFPAFKTKHFLRPEDKEIIY